MQIQINKITSAAKHFKLLFSNIFKTRLDINNRLIEYLNNSFKRMQ